MINKQSDCYLGSFADGALLLSSTSPGTVLGGSLECGKLRAPNNCIHLVELLRKCLSASESNASVKYYACMLARINGARYRAGNHALEIGHRDVRSCAGRTRKPGKSVSKTNRVVTGKGLPEHLRREPHACVSGRYSSPLLDLAPASTYRMMLVI